MVFLSSSVSHTGASSLRPPKRTATTSRIGCNRGIRRRRFACPSSHTHSTYPPLPLLPKPLTINPKTLNLPFFSHFLSNDYSHRSPIPNLFLLVLFSCHSAPSLEDTTKSPKCYCLPPLDLSIFLCFVVSRKTQPRLLISP